MSTYAGLASVMIALAFLYTCACIFLYGGELNAVIFKMRSVKPEQPAFDETHQSRPRMSATRERAN